MDPRNIGERLEGAAILDRVADPAQRLLARLLSRGATKDALHGVWLGHPLHPMLTDLPIGFWTSAFVLDLVGGKRSHSASDALVGLGVASALPTAVTGAADWSELNTPERRSGAVHAVANIVATALYAASWFDRRRGRRPRGIALAMAGATAATVGGFLGGHLAFRRAAGVNHAADVPDDPTWTDITVDGEIGETPVLAHLGDTPIAAIEVDGAAVGLFDRCSHLGGPLHEGELVDGCLRCPWHGSMFRTTDGRVARGPATAPQPAFDVRTDAVVPQARRRPLP